MAQAADPRVLRRGDQDGHLSRLGSGDPPRRGDRRGARFRRRRRARSGRGRSTLLLAAAADEGVRVEWALETHVHADHLSGAPLVKARTGAKIAIGEHVRDVQAAFAGRCSGRGRCRRRFRPAAGRRRTARRSARSASRCCTSPATPRPMSPTASAMRLFIGDNLVHARLRHRADRFPRRQRAPALPLDRADPRRCPRDTRLFHCHDYKAPGRDALCVGNRPLPRSAPPTSMSATGSARTSSWRCARRAMPHSPCPRC